MNKKYLSFGFAMLPLIAMLVGCSTKEDDSNILSILSDSEVYIYDFDNLESGISQREKEISTGTRENTYHNQILLENTKLLKTWADEKGIDINAKNWGWGDTLTQNLLAGFLAKETPDIINGETQLPEFANKGYIEPFPDDLADYVRNYVSPLAYKAMEFDGKIYGVSMTPSVTALFWNKTILRACNIDETIIENGPSSWNQLKQTMATIHTYKDEKQNYYNAGGVYVGAGGVNYGAFLRTNTLLAAAGGSFVDKTTGAPNMVTEANEAAYSFLTEQRNYSATNMLNTKVEDNYFKYFNSGNMAYKIDGLWALTEAKENGIDVGCCLMPSIDGNGDRSLGIIGATYLSVSKFAKHKDLAFEFIKFSLSENIQKNIAKGGYRAPVLLSAFSELGNTESEYYEPYFASVKTYHEYATSHEISILPNFILKKGSRSNIWSAVGNSLALTNNSKNTKTIRQILEDAQNVMMKEWNKG